MKTLKAKYCLFGLFVIMGYGSLRGMELQPLFPDYFQEVEHLSIGVDQYDSFGGHSLPNQDDTRGLVSDSNNKKRSLTKKKQSIKESNLKDGWFIVCDFESCNKKLVSDKQTHLKENYLSHYASCHTDLEIPCIKSEINEGRDIFVLTCPSCGKNLYNNRKCNMRNSYAKHCLLNHNQITKETLTTSFSKKVLPLNQKITTNDSQLKEFFVICILCSITMSSLEKKDLVGAYANHLTHMHNAQNPQLKAIEQAFHTQIPKD